MERLMNTANMLADTEAMLARKHPKCEHAAAHRGAAHGLLALAAILSAIFSVAAANGQGPCDARWLPGSGPVGLDGSVAAMVNWDPDGSGPLPPVVVVGGAFSVAGRVVAGNIAIWNPAIGQWSGLGAGLRGTC